MTCASRRATVLPGAAAALALVALRSAAGFGPWAVAQKLDTIDQNSSELNTPSQGRVPDPVSDGLSLYLASNRPGGEGGLDIWVATRSSASAPSSGTTTSELPSPTPASPAHRLR